VTPPFSLRTIVSPSRSKPRLASSSASSPLICSGGKTSRISSSVHTRSSARMTRLRDSRTLIRYERLMGASFQGSGGRKQESGIRGWRAAFRGCPLALGPRRRLAGWPHGVQGGADGLGAVDEGVAVVALPVRQPQLGGRVALVEVADRAGPARPGVEAVETA